MSLVCRREIWIMTKYFQVEDGVVVKGPRDLPKSHANISGFHHLDAAGAESNFFTELQANGLDTNLQICLEAGSITRVLGPL